jgi:hypothetical protein
LVDEIVAAPDEDFLGVGASTTKVKVSSRAVQTESMPAANINPE